MIRFAGKLFLAVVCAAKTQSPVIFRMSPMGTPLLSGALALQQHHDRQTVRPSWPYLSLVSQKKSHMGATMKGISIVLIVIGTISVAGSATILESRYQQRPGGDIGLIDKLFETQVDSIAPDSTGMGTLTSVELARKMVPGWNVGNSLDAIGGETAWGNPMITQRLIDSVKAAGFNAIRIPVAWSNFINTSTFTIDSALLARVEQVINYALNDSMYAIINEHWDGGWQQPTYADSAYVNHRLAVMWRQIAIHFRDYGDHLLFAGTNEIMVTNNYGTPTVEYYTVQNSFNQTFVNAVRSTGGRNFYRYLLVQGFNTNIDYTVNFFAVPNDAVQNRLMVEVHYYDPYDFTLNTNNSITQWGIYAKDPAKTETWANESYADGQFQKMKTKFIDHGYGVILGEYGVIARLNLGSASLNAQYADYRRYYMQYITRSLERHGLVPFYWDNGYTGNNGLGIFDRSTGAQAYPDIVDAVIDTGNVGPVVGILQSPLRPTKFFLAQNYPNPFNPTTVISYQLSAVSHVTLKVYDILGREVTTLVDGEETAGYHEVTFDGSGLASGVCFCKMTTPIYFKVMKMLLVK